MCVCMCVRVCVCSRTSVCGEEQPRRRRSGTRRRRESEPGISEPPQDLVPLARRRKLNTDTPSNKGSEDFCCVCERGNLCGCVNPSMFFFCGGSVLLVSALQLQEREQERTGPARDDRVPREESLWSIQDSTDHPKPTDQREHHGVVRHPTVSLGLENSDREKKMSSTCRCPII